MTTTGGTVRVPAPKPKQQQDNQVGPSDDGADSRGDGAGRQARVGCFPNSIERVVWADVAGRPNVQAKGRSG